VPIHPSGNCFDDDASDILFWPDLLFTNNCDSNLCHDNEEPSPIAANADAITVFDASKPNEEKLNSGSKPKPLFARGTNSVPVSHNARHPIPGPLSWEYLTARGDPGPSDAVVADSLTHRKHVQYKPNCAHHTVCGESGRLPVAQLGPLVSRCSHCSHSLPSHVNKAHSGVDVNFAPRLRLNRAAPLTKLGIGKAIFTAAG
jgi:hypothetical protein